MPTVDLVEVPALCEFSYQGRSYVPGEMVECTPVEAVMLSRQYKVTLSRFDVPKRKYLRRDMTAEDVSGS